MAKKKSGRKKIRSTAHHQGELAGMRPARNKIVEKVLLEYLDARGDHADSTKAITNAKQKLFRTLKEQELKEFQFRNNLARLKFDEDVEVKTIPKKKKE